MQLQTCLLYTSLKVGGVVDIKPFPNVAQRHILCKRCSIDEFIIYPVNGKSSRLQEMGYEIKQGKYISFRAAGQERFTRTKTLGAAVSYTHLDVYKRQPS